MKLLSGGPLYGTLPTLPTNCILGWKGLPGTNTLAYYENSLITVIKSYILLGPGVNLTILFYFVLDATEE